METPEFLRVLQHFPDTTIEEAEAVRSLKENYPFSQVLHTLSARVSKDHDLSNSKSALQMAAVYSADRGVLKEIMEATQVFIGEEAKSDPEGESNDVANNVLEDLAKLHKSKHKFEMLFAEGPVSTQAGEAETAVTTTPVDEQPVTHKSKKERIVQLAKEITSPVAETILEPNSGIKSPRRRKKDPIESFIEEIVVSKEELTPETDKHKKQIEMIDQFIKTAPSISGTKDKQAQHNDLSTIRTGEFGDHIISETLVEILLKQGKKDKAVEVLKKLIWKFPQKKAYFAAQIEELKK